MESVSMAASLDTRVLSAEMSAHPTAEEVKVVRPPPSFVPTAVIQVIMGFSVTKLYKLPMIKSVLPSVWTVYLRVNPVDVSMGVWMGFMEWNVTFDVIAPTGLPVNRGVGPVWPQVKTLQRPLTPMDHHEQHNDDAITETGRYLYKFVTLYMIIYL